MLVLGYGTRSFQYQLNSLGSMQPLPSPYGTGNYSNTQATTVQPGIHLLLGQAEVSCPQTQRYSAATETHTQDLAIQGRGP